MLHETPDVVVGQLEILLRTIGLIRICTGNLFSFIYNKCSEPSR